MTRGDISKASIETVEIDVPDGVALKAMAHPGSIPQRMVRVRMEFEVELSVPEDYDASSIESYMNDSSWCSGNVIEILRGYTKDDECDLCSRFHGTYVGEVP